MFLFLDFPDLREWWNFNLVGVKRATFFALTCELCLFQKVFPHALLALNSLVQEKLAFTNVCLILRMSKTCEVSKESSKLFHKQAISLRT